MKVNNQPRAPLVNNQETNVIIFYPPEENSEPTMTSAEAEADKKIINPKEDGFKIQRSRGVGRGGFLLQTKTREEKTKIMSDNKIVRSGLTVVEPGRVKPKVIIYDIPAGIDKNEVISCIWSQNLKDNLRQEEVAKNMKLIKARDNKEHFVYEKKPEIRNILVKEERVYIDYDRCRVKDFLDITRCYRCQVYGHIGRSCMEKDPMCSHCTGNHDYKDCKNKNDPEVCGACKRVNKESAHSVDSRECPAFIRAAEVRISRTNYG